MARTSVAAVLLVCLPGLVAAQGLGDASRREKQRRTRQTTEKAKTYTEEDLADLPPIANDGAGEAATAEAPAYPPVPAAPPAASQSGRALLEDSAPPATTEADARARAEERWRSRVAAARQAVDEARQAYETLASMHLVPGYEYVDEHGRTVIRSVEELQGLTARAKADLEAAEKALKDLLEEARRANVPPGWLR